VTERERLAPLPVGEWPPSMREALAALQPANPRWPLPRRDGNRPKALNALGTLARYPELTHAWNLFNAHILFGTTLTPRQRELLVLRVAHLRQAEYEWVQHVVIGLDNDLSRDDIARIAEGPAAWSGLDALLLQAVDDLIADAAIADATWAALADELDDHQLMDVVFTVGAYEILAMAFKSFGVELDEDLRPYR